jgi:hypothetical protein
VSQRKRIPPTKPHAPANAAKAPTPLPYLVRMENMTVGTWLRQIAAYRPQLPIEDRLETLLWSWPIRRAITQYSPNPLWTYKGDDEETLERKMAVLARIDSLEGGWYPFKPPSKIDDAEFTNTCRHICDQLRDLPGVIVPDPDDDPLWLALQLEHGWGDGRRDYRRDLQDDVVNPLSSSKRRQVCEIGERARDAAYLSVRITRSLDAVRYTKAEVKSCIDWLREAGDYEEFVAGQIACADPTVDSPGESVYDEDRAAFSAAFRIIMARRERVTEYLHDAFDNLRMDEGRDRRAQAGKPSRPWVAQADRALKALKLSLLDRRDLLMAWGLKLIPDDPPRT